MGNEIPAVAIIAAVFTGLALLLPQIANLIVTWRTHKITVADAKVNRETRTFVDGAHTKSLGRIASLSAQVAELRGRPADAALAARAADEAEAAQASQAVVRADGETDEGEKLG